MDDYWTGFWPYEAKPRHRYSHHVETFASVCERSSLDLVVFVSADVHYNLRGMRGREERSWVADGRVVLMLIHWTGNMAERVAIGYVEPESWELCSKVRKTIWLG